MCHEESEEQKFHISYCCYWTKEKKKKEKEGNGKVEDGYEHATHT